MSGFNLDAITENASRLGARLQESFSEHTRDLARNASGAAYLDAADDRLKNVRAQLDGSSDREKLEAMRRLIAAISKGRDVSTYFAQVVKNVAAPSLEVRKLVYIYLLRYAEAEPDLALLSVNTFQRDLADANPLIRAMALRVLAGVRVPAIGSIVVLAIRKCASDPSPYVRKAAAYAIPKCYSLDPAHLSSLIPILQLLLRDRSPLSLGAVAVAFTLVCPTRLDLLHPHVRRLARTLADVDEWGQAALLPLLLRYARTMLPRPARSVVLDRDGNEAGTREEVDPDLQLILTSAEPLFMSRNPAVVLAVARVFFYGAPPSQLPIIVQPLLRIMQTSPAVERVVLAYVLVICQDHASLFAPHYTRFLVRSDDLVPAKTLKMQVLLCLVGPENHQALLREFTDYAEDVDDGLVASTVRAIGHCARLVPGCEPQCLAALMAFIKSRHEVVVSNAVLVLKSLVQSHLAMSTSALPHALLAPPDAPAQADPHTIIAKLAYRVDEITHPQARACVLWLVGQYAAAAEGAPVVAGALEGVAPWAPDVLRKAVRSFGSEAPSVRLQTITLAAKLLVLSPSDRTLLLLSAHAFALARYDTNYDVRDRGRMLRALLGGVAPGLRAVERAGSGSDGEVDSEDADRDVAGVVLRREQVRLILFEGKGGVVEREFWKVPSAESGQALLGALSLVTGREMRGDEYLPDWLEQGAEPTLRDSEDDVVPAAVRAVPQAFGSGGVSRAGGTSALGTPVVLTPVGGSPNPHGSAKGPWTDLDSFYADEEGKEGEEEEESEEEEEGEEEESGEESEEASEDDGTVSEGASHDENDYKQRP